MTDFDLEKPASLIHDSGRRYRSEQLKFFVEQADNSFVFANYSYKDIDRFVTIYNIAKETGRKLLIGIRAARYLEALKHADPTLNIPDIDDPTPGIYKPRELRYGTDDKDFYEKYTSNVWSSNDVKQKEANVITSMSSYTADELIDIKPSGGLYVHSTSEPFNEEEEIDEERARMWLEKYGLQKMHCHCSGHGSGIEIANIVNKIKPKVIIPIHTEVPELYPILFGEKVKIVQLSLDVSNA